MSYYVKNWASFQHYKKRNPPWIKLHRSTLSDRAFHQLPVDSRALAPMLWLIASESRDGAIPEDLTELAFQLRRTETEIDKGLRPLIDAGFVFQMQSDSEALARRKQIHIPETETETETEREAEPEGPRIIFEIATSHPKLSHLRDESEIPHAVVDAIIQAIGKDGENAVLDGTRDFFRDSDDSRFAPDAYKFFSQFMYRRKVNAATSILDRI